MHRVISVRMAEETHDKLKLLSLVRKKPIGEVIDELIGAVLMPQIVIPEVPAGLAPAIPEVKVLEPVKKKHGSKKRRGW